MGVTTEVEGTGDGSGGTQQVVHVSRLQWVQEALVATLERLCERSPETRVALITFNHEVVVHGDASGPAPPALGPALLGDLAALRAAGGVSPEPGALGGSLGALAHRISWLSEGGSTALGPACVVAMAMAARVPGSKVIVCTDGRANSELGDLESIDDDEEIYTSSKCFYHSLGEHGARTGVVVSIVTLDGTDCRVAELGSVADRTGGRVLRCPPQQLRWAFSAVVLEEEEEGAGAVVAAVVTATLLLSSHLRAINEDEEHEGRGHDELGVGEERGARRRGSSTVTRLVGGATADTEITFEFEARPGHEAALSQVKELPFQLQLSFTPIRCHGGSGGCYDNASAATTTTRVVTRSVPVTDSRPLAEATARGPVLAAHAARLGARLALQGRLGDAAALAGANERLLRRLARRGAHAPLHFLLLVLHFLFRPLHFLLLVLHFLFRPHHFLFLVLHFLFRPRHFLLLVLHFLFRPLHFLLLVLHFLFRPCHFLLLVLHFLLRPLHFLLLVLHFLLRPLHFLLLVLHFLFRPRHFLLLVLHFLFRPRHF
uniref:Circularly permutated Ras protein 1-like n=1 Tax=Petromyzon marinus TaxID=7757 RepID=A0AAJ7XK96_PETMA|nr:circularly permutated Ras protein 1-like [Petromyzon marinus]